MNAPDLTKVFRCGDTQLGDDAYQYWSLTKHYIKNHEFGHNIKDCMVCESVENLLEYVNQVKTDMAVDRAKDVFIPTKVKE